MLTRYCRAVKAAVDSGVITAKSPSFRKVRSHMYSSTEHVSCVKQMNRHEVCEVVH